MHIVKGKPVANSTKVWLTKAGGCVVANNNSKIPEKDLRELLDTITSIYFVIIAEWKIQFFFFFIIRYKKCI